MNTFNTIFSAVPLAISVAALLSLATSARAADVLPDVAASAAVQVAPLVVVVKGKGKSVAGAEVLFSAASVQDKKLFTDQHGQVTLNPPKVPKLTVRVIAKGWLTSVSEINLHAVAQPHVVTLQPSVQPVPPAASAPTAPVVARP